MSNLPSSFRAPVFVLKASLWLAFVILVAVVLSFAVVALTGSERAGIATIVLFPALCVLGKYIEWREAKT